MPKQNQTSANPFRKPCSALLVLSLIALAGCDQAAPLAPAITDCGSDHPAVGAVAILETHFHDVAGTATIVDNCTIEITDFVFDGAGIDVRAVLSDGPEFSSFDIISEDLRDDGPYDETTLTLSLREGMTLDGILHESMWYLSIWCVPAGVSFGDGPFLMQPELR